MALTSFFSALTGLNSNSHTINVIGDNLANLNTVGFKAGQATFAEIIGGMSGFSATGNPIVFGQGSQLNGVVHKQTQGTPEYTGNSSDAMINGNGYFIVATGDGAMGYTRAGRFQFDSTGGLVSSDGYQVMGYMAQDGKIDLSRSIETIEIRMGQFIPASKTTEMAAAMNLDSQTVKDESFSTPITVFDSLGAQHTIKLTFTKESEPGAAAPEWEFVAELAVLNDKGTVVGYIPATLEQEDPGVYPQTSPPTMIPFTGPLTFNSIGELDGMPDYIRLTIEDGTVTDTSGDNWDAAPSMVGNQINFHLNDEQGRSLITSAASLSGTSYARQDGYASSNLSSISFDNEGRIIGLAANGNSLILAQLALATFSNAEGLQKYNGSTLIASQNAGYPSIGTAGSGGRGSVQGSSLEMSNVDMSEEFIRLIIAQRAYQANARVITTSDELYQEAIHLKR